MGYVGRLEDKIRAIALREQGLSYNEILLQVKVSKDTLSRWCKDIVLTETQKQRLISNKILGQLKGSIVAAENKRKNRIERTNVIYNQAKEEVGILSKRDKFIAGITLYAGEGDKADRRVGFANADPKIISFMMEWFKEFCEVPEEKFRGAIWLHEGLDESKAKRFWSELTGIPINQFHKTYIAADKKDSKKVRKNIHQYGVFSIRVSNSAVHRRIMGWIYALFSDKIPSVL